LTGSQERKVSPDELTGAFSQLGLKEGDSVVMHASLESMGTVEGGAAMVLHRLLKALGKDGTLLMPTFTSVTRHSSTHDNYTKSGCWCEEHEDRHLPFIPELQPDQTIGEIAKRLCSWPGSRRSRHPAYSFAAVGKRGDELVREYSLDDPLLPIKRFAKHDPKVVVVGVGLDSVTAIHVPEQIRVQAKFVQERALTFGSKGRTWLNITSLGCSRGFEKLRPQLDPNGCKGTRVGLASTEAHQMSKLIEIADSILKEQPTSLLCSNPSCLSCSAAK
jgi:aminoglycoside 3-N-acetyltransferase